MSTNFFIEGGTDIENILLRQNQFNKLDPVLARKNLGLGFLATQNNPDVLIINIGSSAGTKVHANWSSYCAAKAASSAVWKSVTVGILNFLPTAAIASKAFMSPIPEKEFRRCMIFSPPDIEGLLSESPVSEKVPF